MMKPWLTIVLALVLALQSLAAISEANLPHYPAEPYHDHEHDHQHSHNEEHEEHEEHEQRAISWGSADTTHSSVSSNPSSDHASDHCHQNHAYFYMVLVSAATEIAGLSAARLLPDYEVNHTSTTSPSLFRPPIA